MNEQDMFNQLEELINARNSLIGNDEEINKIYEKDIKAIRQIIKGYKEMKIELSRYRQSTLKRSVILDENIN